MRVILFVSVSFIIHLSLKAQDSSFTDYYFQAKKVTDSLKTYQILIEAHGRTFPFVSNQYVKNEVARSFNFLNLKKPVEKDPDFFIKIIVSDVNADVDYTFREKLNENDVYNLIVNYDVSFALSFEVLEKDTVHIPICTKKHHSKRYTYTRRNPDFDPKAGRFSIARPDDQKPVDQYADQIKESLNKEGVFILDFNEALIKFRKKK